MLSCTFVVRAEVLLSLVWGIALMYLNDSIMPLGAYLSEMIVRVGIYLMGT